MKSVNTTVCSKLVFFPITSSKTVILTLSLLQNTVKTATLFVINYGENSTVMSVKLGKGKTFAIGVLDGNMIVPHNCHLN